MKSLRTILVGLIVLVTSLARAAVIVNVNGTSHTIPQTNEKGWGTNVTAWIQAISANTLQPNGGTFTLTNELDFGPNFGLKSAYIKSRALNPSTAGFFRLGAGEAIGFRNAGNTANLLLTVNSSGILEFNGSPLISSGDFSTALALKANQTSLDATNTAVGLKANQSDLVTANTNISNLQSQVGNPSSSNAFGELVKRTGSGDISVTTVIGNLTGNVTGTVTGNATNVTGIVAKANGGTGANNASVTFPTTGTIPTTASTDTLTNKTLASAAVSDALRLAETVSDPGTPAAGFKSLFASNDGKVYTKDSTGAKKEVGAGAGSNSNLLINSGFEDATLVWTLGTGVTSASSTDRVEGALSRSLTLAATNGDVITQAITPGANLTGNNLEHSVFVKTALTTVQVCATQAGVEIQCLVVPSTNTWQSIPLGSAGAASGTYGVKLKTTSATSGTVLVDAGYVGFSRNIGNLAQANVIGSAIYSNPANCSWSTTSATFANFTAAGTCAAPVVLGSATVPATRIPAISFGSLGPGDYEISVENFDTYISGLTTDSNCSYHISDGATSSGYVGATRQGSSSTSPAGQHLTAHFNYTSGQANPTFQIQGIRSSGNGTCYFDATGSQQTPGMRFTVKYFPNTGTQVASANNSLNALGMVFHTLAATCPAGSVLADGGTTPSVLTSIYGATLPDLRGLVIRGAGTGAAIGGITYSGTLGTRQGDQLQGHYHGGAGIVYMSGAGGGTGASTGGAASFSAPTVGAATTDGTNGAPRLGSETRMANVSLTPCISTASALVPLMVNQVISSSPGVERTESVTFGGPSIDGATGTANCTASPCTIWRGGAGVTSVTRTNTGQYNINFAVPFSSPPTCVGNSANNANIVTTMFNGRTTSVAGVLTAISNTAVGVDTFVDLICKGPK